jgi:hypothetical protein
MRCRDQNPETWPSFAGKPILLVLCAVSVAVPVSGAIRPTVRLWKSPGRVEALNLYYGSAGRAAEPRPPFRYVSKSSGGTSEKLLVRDSRNRIWDVKFGHETKAEVFATRLVWAAGYYVDPTYLVRKGRIGDGTFRDARFELRNSKLRFRPDLEWTWEKNPFAGTRELNGLRILVMLLSDWDNKDGRDWEGNTGVLEGRLAGRPKLTYFITDWGATMGRWGGFFTREKWDCEEYAEQSPKFVKAVDNGQIEWGYKGKHSRGFKDDLTVSDVRWVMTYLGRLRDSQIRDALRAAGATPHETRCFTKSLRQRLNQLRRISSGSSRIHAMSARTWTR